MSKTESTPIGVEQQPQDHLDTIKEFYRTFGDFESLDNPQGKALAGCMALPFKILTILSGRVQTVKKLNTSEVEWLFSQADVILHEFMWQRLSKEEQQKLQEKIFGYIGRLSINGYRYNKN